MLKERMNNHKERRQSLLFPQKRHLLVRPTLCVGHSQVELLETDFC